MLTLVLLCSSAASYRRLLLLGERSRSLQKYEVHTAGFVTTLEGPA